ncbi:MAG: hypothetical protein J6Y02_02445 [Pseudobutyrivibrio sp.]|nr:hypothetical protein [Pseudobutyrivibrio sp.]
MNNRIDNITQEDALIIWKNFSGLPDKFSPQGGKKTFSLVLSEEDAKKYFDIGWNVKAREPKDGDGETLYYLPVKVSYAVKPPKVVMVTRKNKTDLDEDTIGLLDSKDIERADVCVTPYEWEVGGKHGITAYLKTLYAVIAEDEFAEKYGDYDDE